MSLQHIDNFFLKSPPGGLLGFSFTLSLVFKMKKQCQRPIQRMCEL